MKTKILFLFLALLLYMLLTGDATRGQENITANFESRDNKVTINYKIKGDTDSEYSVHVVLKRQNDPSFTMYPKNLEGDYGEGKYADGLRRIYWTPDADEKKLLYGDDYYFELKAQEVSGGVPWFIILSSFLLVGAATTLILTLK
ncbi:MAG: hypothetical protein ACM3SM_15705 [Bacteroidota bacterium]